MANIDPQAPQSVSQKTASANRYPTGTRYASRCRLRANPKATESMYTGGNHPPMRLNFNHWAKAKYARNTTTVTLPKMIALVIFGSPCPLINTASIALRTVGKLAGHPRSIDRKSGSLQQNLIGSFGRFCSSTRLVFVDQRSIRRLLRIAFTVVSSGPYNRVLRHHR